MGKGDVKTRRGKIVRGTFGKTRPRKKGEKAVAPPSRSTKKK
jgi:30S ribosomal protein S31